MPTTPKTCCFSKKLLHHVSGPRRLVAVVSDRQFCLPAINTAGVVGHIKRSLDAEPHLVAEFLGRAGEWR